MPSTNALTEGQTDFPSSQPVYLTLPPELLCEIFSYICDRTEPLDLIPSKEYIIPGPYFLGRICRHWRDFVFSSPSLWTYMHLVQPALLSKRKSQVLVALLAEYLGHSEGLPLTIRVGIRHTGLPYTGGQIQRFYQPIFELLAAEHHRWKTIEMFDSTYFVTEYMNPSLPQFPLLHSASFGTPVRPSVATVDVTLLQNAPSLHNLSLTGMTLPDGAPVYHHLTYLTASKLFCEDVLALLRRTPNLQSCVLIDMRGSASARATPRTLRPITLMHLESLTARNCAALDELLEGIQSVSSLRDFRCTASAGHHPSLTSLKHLLQRSRCKLETLQIGMGLHLLQEGVAKHIEPLLQLSETLTRLMLRFGMDEKFPETVARILDPVRMHPPSHTSETDEAEEKSPVVCPNLKHLEMEFYGGSVQPVLRMLKNRWSLGIAPQPNSGPVQYGGRDFVRISSARFPEWCRRQVMLQLTEQIEEGLAIDFVPETSEERMIKLLFDSGFQ
ncbi:hypothetical protein CVT26_008195 [Gymnopilus dilepis]|uniref:Uncharacterized protein n=1 Tax=Gymnopilus dilepis TaxID=231916 RepID=A0A409XX58_9AGAR|nr:hypothetical protein CVT26_008195 [Gymnopilus dilepis]